MVTRSKPEMRDIPRASFIPVQTGLLQRKCACGGAPGVDGECAECRNKRLEMQRRSANQAEPSAIPPVVHEVLGYPGQALDAGTRAYMEPRMRHDFSKVRVHTNAPAAESARSVNALAYTVGQNVAFGPGQYRPDSSDGKRLLAHELTHVVQQSMGELPETSARMHSTREGMETEAVIAENALLSGKGFTLSSAHSVSGIQRKKPEAGTKTIPKLDMGNIKNAKEQFYSIEEPVLADTPAGFKYKPYASETDCDIGGAENLTPKKNDGNWIVSNIPWTVSCIVNLPKWKNFIHATAPDRNEWARFMKQTRIHEQGHVDRARNFVKGLSPADRQVTAPNVEQLKQALKSKGEDLQVRLQNIHDQYDLETKHGETQDAMLKPPASKP